MNYVVTAERMYAAEKHCVDRGDSFSALMLRAGRACADIILESFPSRMLKNIAVICGKGENGGDGFVIARFLHEAEIDVSVILACGEPSKGDERENFLRLKEAGVILVPYIPGDCGSVSGIVEKSEVIVDAVFGTGFRGRLDDSLSQLARTVNGSKKFLIAVDIPSGMNCDTGETEGEFFKADKTIAISALKPAHILKNSARNCGNCVIADIGIAPADFEETDGYCCFTLDEKDIKNYLPERLPVSNKGTYGKAACICGCYSMPGAAYISSAGAVRSGAGLVKCIFPDKAYPAIAPRMTEQVILPVKCSDEGFFSSDSVPQVLEEINKNDALLIGCGIGNNGDTAAFLKKLLPAITVPVVLDADALNIIAGDPGVLNEISAPVIITPHPGEMSRLCGKSIPEILADPVGTARGFAEKYGCTVVLKGANTVVCGSDNKKIYINTTGNSGLAKGGSGDLLAGMLVSLLVQGMEPFKAACSAVFMHGDAADEIAGVYSGRGMTVTDIIYHLPRYYSKFE